MLEAMIKIADTQGLSKEGFIFYLVFSSQLMILSLSFERRR